MGLGACLQDDVVVGRETLCGVYLEQNRILMVQKICKSNRNTTDPAENHKSRQKVQ